MLSQQFLGEMEQKLIEAKKKLGDELGGLKAHQELGSDLDSNVQEVEDDEVSRDMIARIRSDLEKINKALGKVGDGTYGTDDEGKDISEARLRAIPWADKAI